MSALGAVTTAVIDTLQSAGVPVVEYVEQNPQFPYVILQSGVETRAPYRFGQLGKSILLQAHIFTSGDDYAGSEDALDIAADIERATEYASLTVTGWDVVFCRPEQTIDAGRETINGVPYEHYVVFLRVECVPTGNGSSS